MCLVKIYLKQRQDTINNVTSIAHTKKETNFNQHTPWPETIHEHRNHKVSYIYYRYLYTPNQPRWFCVCVCVLFFNCLINDNCANFQSWHDVPDPRKGCKVHHNLVDQQKSQSREHRHKTHTHIHTQTVNGGKKTENAQQRCVECPKSMPR